MKEKSILYIVVPCYNEEEVLPETSKRLKEKLTKLIEDEKISKKSKIMFVDDGSKDKTWELISSLHTQDKMFTGVKLSRNKGHQNALLAGLETAKKYADVTISLDADLQDDINAIDKMMAEYYVGSDIVYGVRSARKKDTAFKRMTAEGFYKIMEKFGVDIVFNHADYRLMSKRALDALFEYQEKNVFLRGIIPQIGYKTSKVEYERAERFAGKSKYPLKKMLALAGDGITSFSIKPLILIMMFGIVLGILGFVGFVTTLVLMYVIHTSAIWPLISFATFLTGIIVFAVGIVGVYVGKTYIETKNRPRYFIEKELNDD